MWSDNGTDRDFLNFRYVADIAAEMIAQAGGRPLSMGISGSWGVGKSSMMRLLSASLRERTDAKFLFVEFNAWLNQGYDDTRAALMEVIAQALIRHAETEDAKEHTEEQKTLIEGALERAKSLLARVNSDE
jgi:predicted KAP-like P-loop ATPase